MNTAIACEWEAELEALEKQYPDAFPKTKSGNLTLNNTITAGDRFPPAAHRGD
jgi:hypothetical protein